MIFIKLLGFAMLIGVTMGSVLGLQIIIDRLAAARRRKRKAARCACGNIVSLDAYRKRKERNA